MDSIATIGLTIISLILFSGFCGFAVVSIREREPRAARIAWGMAALALIFLLATWIMPPAIKVTISGLLVAGGLAAIVLFLFPLGNVERGGDMPGVRVDERDIMFARAHLTPGTANYKAYYTMRPENQAGDDKTRKLPGLLSPNAGKSNLLAFASSLAGFSLTEDMRDTVDGPVAEAPTPMSAEELTPFIKKLTQFYGAYTVGITELQPYHVYSHIGRGAGEYGAPITLNHRYAIAFTVEMDYEQIGPAPDAPVVMESARQYVESAKVAVQLGYLIRSLGYPARAHIDGNYRVIAPLVARDAGLGELGRMGLLMTPELGPRVRLGVVTTDLPLIPDLRSDNTSVLDFCRICKKCAENCPSRSISMGNRQEIDGVLRWQINSDSCFRYWNAIGTDCARCMAVCPYSHPNNAAHNLVRWSIERSGAARQAALWLDDAFYGRTPEPRPFPDWIPLRK